ncbi:MAG: hypothetical protein FP827_08915 [Candidatus Omnitrophica bacterium]|nr:hypothetical protein [Candidatus Omnitrophota bacterium]
MELEKISKEVLQPSDLQDIARSFSPDFISSGFSSKSNIPIASVCLQDAVKTLGETNYALHEVFAHKRWYLEKKKPPNKIAAAYFTRFYSDDAALRLYSAGEHLANGIIMMLEINDSELKPYRKKTTSQQSTVGHFLLKEKATHTITKAISTLVNSTEWSKTIEYRNDWVHDQPPLIKELGIVYKRKNRWEKSKTGKSMVLFGGSGDKPEYSVDDLINFIKPAMFQFSEVLDSVIEFYIKLLEPHGIRFESDNGEGNGDAAI